MDERALRFSSSVETTSTEIMERVMIRAMPRLLFHFRDDTPFSALIILSCRQNNPMKNKMNEHRTSNAQHRMLNLKDEKTDVGIKDPNNKTCRRVQIESSRKNAHPVAVQYCFSFDVRCSAFDVGRSSLGITSTQLLLSLPEASPWFQIPWIPRPPHPLPTGC